MPFNANNQRRTKENYASGLKAAIKTGKPYQGIKGACQLNRLRFYSVASSIQIDLMHTVGLGVIKELFYYWFDAKIGPYTLRNNYDKIEKRYLRIRPPSYTQATPRSITEFNIWKAKEFINFILLYSLPLFHNLMPDKHYSHLTKLVVALEILLDKKVLRDQLPVAEKLLQDFVKDAAKLYSPAIMKSGMHELLHLVECTKEIGPLVCFSCFPFEELNRKFLKFVNGRDLMGEEFFKLFIVSQELQKFVSTHCFSNELVKDYIVKNTEIKSSNRKFLFSNSEFKLLSILNCNDEQIFSLFNHNSRPKIFYKVLKYKGFVYKKFNDFSKYNDSCISYKNSYGLIEAFFLNDNRPYVICKYIYDLDSFFFVPLFPNIKHRNVFVHISNNYFIAPVYKIKKVFLIQIDKTRTFINYNSTSHFFT